MKDARAIKLFAMIRIKTVTFRQKEFERTRSRLSEGLANRPLRVQLSRRSAIIFPPRMVFDRVPLLSQRHLCIEVWQVIEGARAPHRQTAGCVQRKEPNTRKAVEVNIGADIEFVKSAGAGN